MVVLLTLSSCGWMPATLTVGGDVMLSRSGEPIFSMDSPWGEVETLLNSEKQDFFAVNLESPIGNFPFQDPGSEAGTNLCADKQQIRLLVKGSVDLVTRVNNHALDCLPESSQVADSLLAEAGILSLAIPGEVNYVKSGMRTLAILSLNLVDSQFDPESLRASITQARKNSALVVISLHWGNEYQAGPTESQEEIAQILVDEGADVIWGHHPHVLQRIEWLTSTLDGHEALVIYSLGNLLSDQRMLPDAQRSALVRLRFSHHRIQKVQIIPLVMDEEVHKLTIAGGEDEKRIMERLVGDSSPQQEKRIEFWRPANED